MVRDKSKHNLVKNIDADILDDQKNLQQSGVNKIANN